MALVIILAKDLVLIVANITSAGWLLFLYLDSIPPRSGVSPLTWRNISFTMLAGLTLWFAKEITNWHEIVRYWRVGTTLLMISVGVLLVADRVFEFPTGTLPWILRRSPTIVGAFFILMVLAIWAQGIS